MNLYSEIQSKLIRRCAFYVTVESLVLRFHEKDQDFNRATTQQLKLDMCSFLTQEAGQL